jgi:hypothetical protein
MARMRSKVAGTRSEGAISSGSRSHRNRPRGWRATTQTAGGQGGDSRRWRVRQERAPGQHCVLGLVVVVVGLEFVRRVGALPGARPSQRLLEGDLLGVAELGVDAAGVDFEVLPVVEPLPAQAFREPAGEPRDDLPCQPTTRPISRTHSASGGRRRCRSCRPPPIAEQRGRARGRRPRRSRAASGNRRAPRRARSPVGRRPSAWKFLADVV